MTVFALHLAAATVDVHVAPHQPKAYHLKQQNLSPIIDKLSRNAR